MGLELSLASVAEGGPSEYSVTERLGHMGPQLVAGVCVYYLILFHSALCCKEWFLHCTDEELEVLCVMTVAYDT